MKSENKSASFPRVALTLILTSVLAASFSPTATAQEPPITVQANLLCPTNLTATLQSNGSVLVAFDADAAVTGTSIYRSVDGSDAVKIAELEPGQETFLDVDVAANVVIEYEVRALLDLAITCPTTMVQLSHGQACPPTLSATVHSNGTVLLSLEAVVNATALLRSEGGDDPIHLTTVDAGAAVFLDVNVILGATYTYHVMVGTNLCLIIEVTIPGDGGLCPSVRAVVKANGSILLLFGAVLDVDAATLLRAEAGSEATTLAQLDAGASLFLDVSAQVGIHYAYHLILVINGVSITCPGPEVTPPSEDPCPTDLSATAHNDGSIRIEFQPHPDAEGSRIYRDGDGQAQLVAQLGPEQKSWVDTNTTIGKTYTYEVRSVIDGNVEAGCPTIEVTAIPVFPTIVGGLLASLLGIAAYVGLRRRK